MSIMLPFFRLRHIDILGDNLCGFVADFRPNRVLVEVFPNQVFQFLDALIGD
jgi:hypothetical protein